MPRRSQSELIFLKTDLSRFLHIHTDTRTFCLKVKKKKK